MVEKSHTSGFWPSLYDPFRSMGARVADWFAPASEAATNETAYKIVMELPGVDDKDIDLTVAEGVVTVKGEKRSSREDSGDTWYFSEREYGAFSRSFRLPPDADPNQVAADLKDGVLRITVSKKAPARDEAAKSVPINRG
ncbi:Hsp20/alpha crystallin family protein [Rhodophyticola porphyridii]|uniref:Hsp20/alpha crystallin family protein n=1 Tax=Rhodophyticola porphyridii TaxID=1852017 RepID=UPI0035CE877F